MSDKPSESDLAMAQAGQTAEALRDLDRPSAEEQREADEESAELLGSGAEAAAEQGISLTDIYSRVNTAHGAGAGAVLVQNPYTFSDDIARGNLPPTATDPDPNAEPTEPETPPDEDEPRPELRRGEQEVDDDGNPVTTEKAAPVYPNIAHPLGTPEDLLYKETGLIATTVSNVDGVSIVNVDPEATEVEAPVAGNLAPLGGPPDDKKTVDKEMLEEGDAADEDEVDEVEQVDSDYDPGEHTVAEVNEYIEDHPEEADAIYAAEQDGKARTGILG